MTFADRITEYQVRINTALDFWLPQAESTPDRLNEALRYSVMQGGKRLRPLLVYAAGEALNIKPEKLDPIAVAVELVHAYSLVHDDLPAMDDDDLRRGQPTSHIKFGEATAILVGDALQSLAYYVLSNDAALREQPAACVRVVACLAAASGSYGMVGGQMMDIEAEGKQLDTNDLEEVFTRKTGALIRASIVMPSYLAEDLTAAQLAHLDGYAQLVGLAFQIKDDVLDVEAATETLGKPQGSDIRNGKSSYPSLVGLEQAKLRADNLYSDAVCELAQVERHTESLEWLSRYIVQRDH